MLKVAHAPGFTLGVLTRRMGQQHYSPGQSVATKRREAPPWVCIKHDAKSPERLKGRNNQTIVDESILSCPSGQCGTISCDPGRRFATFRRYALPWARLLLPRMGQRHLSPGQSGATKRREAPPWVTAKRPTLP